MITVPCWTGAETKALRQALRLSIRAFAAHLGIDARTINKWEARHTTIILRPHTQELMDTALQQAPEDAQTRFTQIVRSAGQTQHENAAEPAAPAEHSSHTEPAPGADYRTPLSGNDEPDSLLTALPDSRHRDTRSSTQITATTALPIPKSAAELVLPQDSAAVTIAGQRIPDDIAGLLLPFLGDVQFLARSDLASALEREVAYDRLVRLLSGWAENMKKRRELLCMLGWAASAVAGRLLFEGLHPEEQVRVARAIEAPSRVDNVTIDHIDAILWRCIRQDDGVLGAQATFDTVLAQRNLVRLILPECPTGLRPRLLSSYSHHSAQAGWLLYDLNDFDGAGYYFEQARATAHEAENTELGAFALCMMSHLATWRGQPRVGIDHAVAAQGWAAQTDEPRLHAYAADVAARAYAGVGQKTLCMRQLETIERNLVRVSDDAAEDSVAHFYSKGQFAGTRSLCLLQLHDTQGALSAAQKALIIADPAFVRNFAFTKLFLGEAYAAAGGIQEATAAIGEAAALTARNRSARLVGRVQAARDQLAQCHIPSVVQSLDEQLHAYGLSNGAMANREP